MMEEFKKGEIVRHKLTKEEWIILEPYFEHNKFYGYRCRNKDDKKELFRPEEIEKIK